MKKIITNKTFNYKFTALKSLIFLLVFYAIGPQNLAWAQGEFVLHVVAPQATDPAIDRALDDHLAWLDPTAPTNHKLIVLLPGFDTIPTDMQLVQQEAARLGYHVIGLMYVNSVFLAGACDGSPDPNSCFEDAQFEIVYGNGLGIDSPIVDVNQPNSIINRLTKLLQYLDANDPTEGWAEFLAHGAPKWSKIAVGGHSQGGSAAVMIAKYHVVDRVVMISAVTDTASDWVLTHVTPSARYWGLAHEEEFFLPEILASWASLGITAFGPVVTVETSSPPYGFTHTLATDLKPRRNGTFHRSTALDRYTPLNHPGNTPALADAWGYMMSQ
jgi:pimeloyl-ACP methyl ester carboxylesterase